MRGTSLSKLKSCADTVHRELEENRKHLDTIMGKGYPQQMADFICSTIDVVKAEKADAMRIYAEEAARQDGKDDIKIMQQVIQDVDSAAMKLEQAHTEAKKKHLNDLKKLAG